MIWLTVLPLIFCVTAWFVNLILHKRSLLYNEYHQSLFTATLLYIFVISNCHTQSTFSLTNWETLTPSVPQPDSRSFCGYHTSSNSIYMLGGFTYNYQLWKWDLNTNQFTQYADLSTPLVTFGQAGAVYGDFIYFVYNYQIGRFNMNTRALNYPISTVTTTAYGRRPCLAISANGRYLFIIGGSPTTGSSWTTRFHIYDTVNDILTQGPNMNRARSTPGCIISDNGFIYAVGGYNAGAINTVEKIDASNIGNIQSQSWQYIDNMAASKSRVRATKLNGSVYLIGGSVNNIGGSDHVEVIYPTEPDTLYMDNPMPGGRAFGCALTVDQDIYYLLGSTSASSIFRTYLVTPNPTNAPSTSPNSALSTSPTYAPTTCLDYDVSYQSDNGFDKVNIVSMSEETQFNTVQYGNTNFVLYESTDSNNIYYDRELINCTSTSNPIEICFIGCFYRFSCKETIVK
eukprot:446772_1